MSYRLYIDINADVGEGLNNEALLVPLLSSCNIACGGHAGNLQTMTTVVNLAKKYGVKIGAHPSFPDRVNFGRELMDISPKSLFKSLRFQVNSLIEVTSRYNSILHHVKPHGALYNLALKDEVTANIIVDVINSFETSLKLYAPYKSVLAERAKRNDVEVLYEGFADRNYNDDLSLVSRKKSNALITEKELVFNHVFNMVFNQKITTVNRVEAPIIADTICVHGDTKNAIEILEYLHQKLEASNVKII